jgi:hypothetical protein
MGELTINSRPLPVDAALESLKEGLPSTMLTHYLKVTAIMWPRPKPLERFLHKLDFVKNRTRWYPYFQGSLRPISEATFRAIASDP